jgi:pimeloyl-ACP methyl ester carboxylesterase
MMPFLSVNSSDIFYTDHGSGDPIVLLHGRSASGGCWDWHIPHLARNNRVIAYDSVNHGFSSNSPADEEQPNLVDELDAVLDALGIDHPILIGQSMGTMTSLRWATRYPDRARAIVGAGMGWPLPPIENVGPAPLRDGLWLSSRNWNPEWAAENTRIVEAYSRIRSTATAIENSLRPRRFGPNEWLDPAFGDRLAHIRSQVALFVGADDFAAEPARTLATILPNAELHVVERADHNAYLQCLDDFLAVVDGALARANSTS